jgi:cytochrome c-type biogenesis protein CcmH
MSLRLAAVLLTAFVVWGCAPDSVPNTQSDVEERLTCQCGCGLTVHSCNHLQCGFAVPVRKDITDSLAAGQTGAQILDRYVREYGEKVLSSPTRTGFNLLAWYGPYVAIFLSALLVLHFMRRWHGRNTRPAAHSQATSPLSDEQRNRLDRELERFE